MAITNHQQIRLGNVTLNTVTSDLSPPSGGVIYYHWYVDGAHVARTITPSWAFGLKEDDQVRVAVQDTTDPDYDPVANAPAGYAARRTLWWVRSIDEDTCAYRVEQKEGAGDWETIGVVAQQTGVWEHTLLTPRLTDLVEYTWRITPLDLAGNAGTALTIGPEKIVRTPDAPRFTATFDSGTTKVTFAAAA